MYIFVLFSQLDLSYNRLRKIEGLENLTNLRKLFLVNNKISKIEKINHLTKLEMLELGANRIRVSPIFCLLFTEVQVFGSVTFVLFFFNFFFYFYQKSVPQGFKFYDLFSIPQKAVDTFQRVCESSLMWTQKFLIFKNENSIPISVQHK